MIGQWRRISSPASGCGAWDQFRHLVGRGTERVLPAVATPAVKYWAYHRDGGWPGVHGWDYGMHIPLFLTVQITAALIG